MQVDKFRERDSYEADKDCGRLPSLRALSKSGDYPGVLSKKDLGRKGTLALSKLPFFFRFLAAQKMKNRCILDDTCTAMLWYS